MANFRTTLRHYEAEQAVLQKLGRKERQAERIAKMHRKPAKLIEALFLKKIQLKDLPEDSDFREIGQVLQNKWRYARGKKKGFFEFLSNIARKNTTIIYQEATILRYAFHYASHWVRNPKGWVPKADTPLHARGLVLDLLHYLFAEFPIPEFMNQAWAEQNERYIRWFIHLGKGLNIRTAAGVSIELTKKMAHFFGLAPKHYSIQKALRYAQIMGMGGTVQLVEDLNITSVGRMLEHKDFWTTVLKFFIQHAEMGAYTINQVVEYIYHQKFLPRRNRNSEGKWEMLPPPKPRLTLKGRTASSLQKSVDKWKDELEKERDMLNKLGEDEFIQWRAISIRDFNYRIERSGWTEAYKISQLVSNLELKEEGRAMNHCVATYVPNCIDGNSSIWTMTLNSKQRQKPKRLVTIEVDEDNIIQQVKGKNNEPPSKEILDIINIWMDAEQLTLDEDY